jgi:hypothetical protein
MNAIFARVVSGIGLFLYVLPSRAADMIAPDQPSPPKSQFYSGSDFTSQSSYIGFIGGNFAPWGNLETSGFRLGFFSGAGGYRYSSSEASGASTVTRGTFLTDDFLIGYGFNKDALSVKFMTGVNVQNHVLSPNDPGNPVNGPAVGLKLQGDLYANPTPKTMVFAQGAYSTAFQTYFGTFNLGYEFTRIPELYIGPQFIAQGNEHYDQWRVGAQISGMKFGGIMELSIAGGYLRDSRNGPGAYGQVIFNFQF